MLMSGFSISKEPSDLGAVNGLVASRRPTRPLGQEAGVIDVSDDDSARDGLLLEMALQTKSVVPFR